MKEILALSCLIALGLPVSSYAQSQESVPDRTTFPVTEWVSQDATKPVTIQNGAGTPVIIVIHVNDTGTNSAGVNIKNCGTTTNIKAGSTTICETNDAANPVTLTSDSTSFPAVGTYQIKPK